MEPFPTQEQYDLVAKINQTPKNFERLGIPPDATTQQLLSRFRKLTLILHPDKNKAPGATAAFQGRVSTFILISLFNLFI